MKNFILGCLVVMVIGLTFYVYIKYHNSEDPCFIDNGEQFVPLPPYNPTKLIQKRTEVCTRHT